MTITINKPVFKIAILDMYKGTPNQGMRCIKKLIHDIDEEYSDIQLDYEVFDVRGKAEIPGLNFDMFIATGGPGSPYDGKNQPWENKFFNWLDVLIDFNQQSIGTKKHLLAICHSFQLICIHFDIADIAPRKSGSFGILPVHLTEDGIHDDLFSDMGNPFYAADFREWQVLKPRLNNIHKLGANILAIEKERPHIGLERAVMAIRISPEIVGTQFHPEADPEGMLYYFQKDDQRKDIIKKHGVEKYQQILHNVSHQDYLSKTYDTFLPNFIRSGIKNITEDLEVK